MKAPQIGSPAHLDPASGTEPLARQGESRVPSDTFLPYLIAFTALVFLRAVFIYAPPEYLYANSNDFFDSWLPFLYIRDPFYQTIFNLGYTLDRSLNGIPLNLVGVSELNLYTLMFDLLPDYYDVSAFMIVNAVLMFLSTYLVAIRVLAGSHTNAWAGFAACLAALYLSIIDIQPAVIGSVIALNFTIYGALAVLQGERGCGPVLSIVLAPFLSQAPFGAIFYYPFFVFLCLIFIRASQARKLLVLFGIATVLMVIVDYRIFCEQLFGDTMTHRDLWMVGRDDPQFFQRLSNPDYWRAAGRLTLSHFLEGQWHFAWNPSSMTLILFAGAPAYLVLRYGIVRASKLAFAPRPGMRLMNLSLGGGAVLALAWLIALSIGYGILNGPLFDFWAIFGVPLQFDRGVLVLAPLSGAVALAVSFGLLLSRLAAKRLLVATGVLAFVVHAAGTYASPNSIGKLRIVKHLAVAGLDNPFLPVTTLRLYYLRELFDEIKARLGDGWEEETVVSIGLDPFVAAVNGFRHLDGYFQAYPAGYKAEFREITALELALDDVNRPYFDGWGSRIYVFANRFEDGKQLLDINGCAFKRLGGTLLISRYELANPKTSSLVVLDRVEATIMGLQSRLFLYRVSEEACAAP